jgi:hypothetical protein
LSINHNNEFTFVAFVAVLIKGHARKHDGVSCPQRSFLKTAKTFLL